jgi:hypothetical protein
VLIIETGRMTERLRVREIDDDDGRRLVRIIRRGSGRVMTWRRAQMVLLSAQAPAGHVRRAKRTGAMQAAPGTTIQLDFGHIGGCWILTREAGRWVLDEGTARRPAATLRLAPQVAWRQLTGLPVSAGQYSAEGDDSLVRPLLAVRGIIV